VVAAVHGEQEYHEAWTARESVEGRSRRFAVRTAPGRPLGLRIVLTAVLGDERKVTAGVSFGIGGAPEMSRSDVKAQIDRMLGRDPHMRRPPMLAWGPLRAALESIGVASSESELIARPLEISFEASAERAVSPG
jgi:hypothetical protein